jgi:signal transduction histidine kinase
MDSGASGGCRGVEVQASLSAALSGLLEAAVPPGVERALSVEGDEALVPPHVREQLFVILREGVRNAVSHSGAGRIEVGVRVCSGEVVGYVEDDGRGFAEEDGSDGGGTRSMRERAELVGAPSNCLPVWEWARRSGLLSHCKGVPTTRPRAT